MRITKLFAALVAVLVMLSACSTVKLDPKAPVEDRTNKSSSANQSSNKANTGAAGNSSADSRNENSNGKQAGNKGKAAIDPLTDPTSILVNRSVYFDFDSYSIKDEFKAIVEAHSQYLISNTNRKVVIQGNTDERGGSEYNLALGQKRAEAVRRALSLLGVSDAQVEAVSFGKEKPKAMGSDEASWAENRRADLAY